MAKKTILLFSLIAAGLAAYRVATAALTGNSSATAEDVREPRLPDTNVSARAASTSRAPTRTESLGSNSLYRFQVTSNEGESTPNIVATYILPPSPAEDPSSATPTNVSANSMGPTRIDLTWQEAELENGVIIERSTDNSTFHELAALAADTGAYIDTRLKPNQFYYYRLKVTCPQGESLYSNVASANTFKN
jgi:hypothetical protein